MKLIILAAGQGTRLRPLTDNHPKCLTPLHGKPLLHWQIQAARQAGIEQIHVVRGWLGPMLERIDGIGLIDNPDFATTNMVSTLWCAQHLFEDEFIVSYGDIVYEPRVLQALLDDDAETGVVVDSGWHDYWGKRFEDPLDDAETLRINAQGNIVEIGQTPDDLQDIQAQYIGLMAFRRQGVKSLRSLYADARKTQDQGANPLRGQRSLEQLYMTDMLQGMVDAGHPVRAVSVQRGWLEIDSRDDLDLAHELSQPGDLLTIKN